MQPPWLNLLRQWQDANRFGLTVPFIYGALERWPGSPLGSNESPEKKFFEMIRSIANEVPEGTIIRLFTCGTVQDLTLAPVFGKPDFCKLIEAETGSKAGLWVQKDLLHESENTYTDLAHVLWRRYSESIVNKRFSLRSGNFVPFTPADISLIDLAAARIDEDA